MNTRLSLLILAVCGTIATPSVFGQSIYVWTNSASSNPTNTAAVNLANTNNWDPNGVPLYNTGSVGDEMQWDGRSIGNVYVSADSVAAGFSGGDYGLHWHLTGNQTNPVQVFTTVVPNNQGIRSKEFIIDSGAGTFNLGFDSATNALDCLMGGTNPQNHGFTNNSAHPAIIWPNVRWRMGAGGVHFYIFEGTGDWIVNNRLRSQNGAAIAVQKLGTGTMTWTATNTPTSLGNDALGTPVTIGGGTMILKSSDCIANQNILLTNALLKYDPVTGPSGSLSANLPGTITGTNGTLQVNAGQLTLSSGSSTFSGNINLTGGELIAGGIENPGTSGPLGVGGAISFAGGTLGFSVNNIFDYSSRFSTAASQAYSIDTAGQNVTFTNTAAGLTSSGGTLTKLGNGTLTLAGGPSTYGGATTVSLGALVFQSSKTGTGKITVADGAVLGVFATGTQVAPTTLTVGTSSSATLEFNNVNSTTTAIISAGTVSAGGAVIINVKSGTLVPGNGYPLLASGGSAPPVSLGILNGFIGTLSTNGSTIQLNVTATAYKWTGLNNNNWNTSTPNNWQQNGGPVVYGANGPGPAIFDDSVSGSASLTINSPVTATLVTFNNLNTNYTVVSSGANNLGGTTPLIQAGSGTTTLSGGANTYAGATTINAGTLNVGTLADGGSASDIGASSSSSSNLVLNGGTLQYTGGGASANRSITLGTGGGTIDASGSGPLNLNNSGALGYSGNGPRVLTLTGASADTNTLAAPLANNGGSTALTKSGAGTWILTGSSTYSGVTTIANGLLQIGNNGGSGSLGTGGIVNNAALDFYRTGSLTVGGVISGTGSITNDGSGTLILSANNTYSGGTTINAGTVQVGNGGAAGSLLGTSPIVDNSLLIFNTTGSGNSFSANGLISGTGNVIVRGSGGVVKAIGANSYTGWTLIDTNATLFIAEGLTGTLLSSAVTNHGTLRIVSQDNHFTYPGPIVGSGKVQVGINNVNPGTSTFTGTNSYSGGTFIGGGELLLGDGGTPEAGSIAGNVSFVNNFTTADDQLRTLTFNRPDDFTFSGNITTNFTSPQSNLGRIQQSGSGTLTLTGTNTYAGGTLINAGTLQVGNGGTSGSIGSGNITDSSVLIFNRSDNVTLSNVISGVGSLLKLGAGRLTLNTNSYSGITTVSNGTLIINGDNFTASTIVNGGTLGGVGTLYSPVLLDAGTTLAPSGASVGTLTIYSDLTIGGNLAIEVNKSLSPSNDLVFVGGVLTNTGTGTVTVANLGPALAVGDSFTLFSQPVQNGAALAIVGARATWTNHLGVDGGISVTSFVPPPKLNFSRTGTNGSSLQFAWTDSLSTFKLQSQTNGPNVGISTNWVDYPGGGTSPVTVPISGTNTTVFFRLKLVSTP